MKKFKIATLCCFAALFTSCATHIPWDKPPIEEALKQKLYTLDQARKAYSILEPDGTYAILVQTEDLAGSDRYYTRSDLTPQILSLLPSAQARIEESENWEQRKDISRHVSGVSALSFAGGLLARSAVLAAGGVVTWLGSVACGIYFEKQKDDTFNSVIQDYNRELDRKLQDRDKKRDP